MMRAALDAGLPALGLTLTEQQKAQLCRFGQLLVEKNQVMNLTAITEPEAVAQLHFLDSLTVLLAADCKGKSILDVGCGAGFPGVPLAIAAPTAQVTLLDSLQKRIRWLEEVLPQLGIQAGCVAARAEEYAASHREQFELVTSRAVARLNVLCELCLPFVRVGGSFLALKGAMTEEEVQEARHGIAVLGGQVAEIREFPIADAVHRIVVIRKTSPTPKVYPRKFARIKQSPL